MDSPFNLGSPNQNMPTTDQRILWELERTNGYLEIIVEALAKKFPDAISREAIDRATAKRR